MKQTFFSLDETSRLLAEPLRALRRELHEHPELSGQERETIARLKARFSEPPFEVLPLSDEGLLVRISGKAPGKRTVPPYFQ